MKYVFILFFVASQLCAQNVIPLQTSIIDSALLNANFASTNNTVEISNVNIIANDSTIGIIQGFTGYPVSDGIILCTGGAEWGMTGSGYTGPYITLGGGTSAGGAEPYLQSLLTTISPGNGMVNFSNFICIEFDFIPHFDAINFEYIFASTEYQSYTCSQYNDIFGFFLTGPGVSGNYYNGSKNLAVVPGSNNTPVCINSINSGMSSSFSNAACTFVDPNFQSYSYLFNVNNDPTDPDYVSFPFNGYTESLTISDSLMPDSTYHLKMIISDVTDNILNSAVFLNANSFTSYPVDSNMWGCMDSTAVNYNPLAVFDDGSCQYTNIGLNELEDMKDILSHIINPISGDILNLPDLKPNMEVSVYSFTGKRILSSKEKQTDISKLNEGIYIIEIYDGKQRTSGKFVKL